MTTVQFSKLALVLLAGLAMPVRASHASMPDSWITTKTKMALATTDGVSATQVHVDTVDGRVTLHGKVDSEAEKAKAEPVTREPLRVTTRHSGTFGGQRIAYTATAGETFLRADNGKLLWKTPVNGCSS